MMLEQEQIIERIRILCTADNRVSAAMLYGSFARGEGDRFSDVDCFIFFEDELFSAVDKRAWVEQVGPVTLFYKNEFGNYDTIFESLVRAEFHFEPVNRMSQFDDWVGDVFFPSAESVILVDKFGQLEQKLKPLFGEPDNHDNPNDAAFVIDSFLNWCLFGFNLLGRGEWVHAGEVLTLAQDYLLRMVRILEGSGSRWMVPTKLVEQEISADSYARFQQCTAAVESEALSAAYRSAWEWGREMTAELAERHQLPRRQAFMDRLADYFNSILSR